MKFRFTDEERFWRKTCYVGDCIIWTGNLGGAGYGTFGYKQDGVSIHTVAHRFAYELVHGPIPPGLFIDHLCRNRCCVNPAHLEAVTQKVNQNRGRRWKPWLAPHVAVVRRKCDHADQPCASCQRESTHHRFLAKVVRSPETSCWLWDGARAGEGYGVFKWRGRQSYAHRYAHEYYKGAIPDGYLIDHLCRVRLCVNPEHLEAVTCQANILRGMSYGAKIRRSGKCGKGHIKAKSGPCRECHRLIYDKGRYQRNRARIRAYWNGPNGYYAKNREHLRKLYNDWYAKNKAKVRSRG